jgi:UDP-N-acetylmuramoylalanine--D-glutamate ligase
MHAVLACRSAQSCNLGPKLGQMLAGVGFKRVIQNSASDENAACQFHKRSDKGSDQPAARWLKAEVGQGLSGNLLRDPRGGRLNLGWQWGWHWGRRWGWNLGWRCVWKWVWNWDWNWPLSMFLKHSADNPTRPGNPRGPDNRTSLGNPRGPDNRTSPGNPRELNNPTCDDSGSWVGSRSAPLGHQAPGRPHMANPRRGPLYVILGLARSGLSCARALRRMGIDCVLWDDNPIQRQGAVDEGFCVRAPAELALDCAPLSQNDVVLVVSPGIGRHECLVWAGQRGMRVVCDVQLFFDLFAGVQAVGVTGTHGKSTTCALIAYGLTRLGQAAVLAGNIGTPIFSTLVERPIPMPTAGQDLAGNQEASLGQDLDGQANDAPQWCLVPQDALYVLELSSYQLELCDRLPLQVSACLNLSAHHLERHGSMAVYRQAKERIFRHSLQAFADPDLHLPKTLPFVAQSDREFDLPAYLDLPHNRANVAAAVTVLKAIGHQSLPVDLWQGFQGLDHRQQRVKQWQGLVAWNDSKATTPLAAVQALLSCPDGPVFWICGGVLQADDLDGLARASWRLAGAFCYGQAGDRYGQTLARMGVPVQVFHDLLPAIQAATEAALAAKKSSAPVAGNPVEGGLLPQDCHIVFSPGCASFDQFASFEARGQAFCNAINQLWSPNEAH